MCEFLESLEGMNLFPLQSWTNLKLKKFWKKKIVKSFFFDFPKFFSVKIFHMMSRLRMQNLEIIGQGVPELQGVTDRQRNYFSNIDFAISYFWNYLVPSDISTTWPLIRNLGGIPWDVLPPIEDTLWLNRHWLRYVWITVLTSFILIQTFYQEIFLLILVVSALFSARKNAQNGGHFSKPQIHLIVCLQVSQMTLKKLRGHSVKLGALLHFGGFVKNWAETGLLIKIFRWLSFWVWAF